MDRGKELHKDTIMNTKNTTRILILGGGFGGIYAAMHLDRILAREPDIEVTLVNRTEECVQFGDGSCLPVGNLVWTAGTSPNPLLRTVPCHDERGRIPVNGYLEVSGWPGVWALGDCACITDPKTGVLYPSTAQHAIREERIVAENIRAVVRGGTKQPFVFSMIGLLAAIGRRTGVARILGRNFSGFFAWWLWRTIYLSKLPRFEKKLRVALDWTLDLTFSKDIVQFLTHRSESISHGAAEGQAVGLAVLPATLPAVTTAPLPKGTRS